MKDTPHAIFAFPFAGGTAEAIYTKWTHHLEEDIRLYPMEQPGHGRLIKQPLITTMEETGAFFLNKIKAHLENHDSYSLLGHSMGATLAYEVLRQIQLANLPDPKFFFVSGRNSPKYNYGSVDFHGLSDAEFVGELRRVDGISDELFSNEILLKLFLPILRNDYSIVEQYKYKPIPRNNNIQVVGFYSTQDHIVNEEGFALWQEVSSTPMITHIIEGHHFFIETDYKDLCQRITQYIRGEAS